MQSLQSLKQFMSDDEWKEFPVAQTSWSLLQDFYHDPRVLSYPPELVSIACIELALQSYAVEVPGAKRSWIKVRMKQF